MIRYSLYDTLNSVFSKRFEENYIIIIIILINYILIKTTFFCQNNDIRYLLEYIYIIRDARKNDVINKSRHLGCRVQSTFS